MKKGLSLAYGWVSKKNTTAWAVSSPNIPSTPARDSLHSFSKLRPTPALICIGHGQFCLFHCVRPAWVLKQVLLYRSTVMNIFAFYLHFIGKDTWCSFCTGIFGKICEHRTNKDVLQVSNVSYRTAAQRVSERGLYIWWMKYWQSLSPASKYVHDA